MMKSCLGFRNGGSVKPQTARVALIGSSRTGICKIVCTATPPPSYGGATPSSSQSSSQEPKQVVDKNGSEQKGQTPPSLYVELPRDQLKAALLDSLHGTDRGVSASSEVRAEINELIAQLEAKNPTPSTSEAKDMLNGNWRLIYTSSVRTLAILSAGNLPLVTVDDLIQTIDTTTNTVENKVNLQMPFTKTQFSTVASFEVRSPKRLQVKFERGVIQTPTLLEDINFPSQVSVFGQSIDLNSLNQILEPGYESLKGVVGQLGNLISQAPNLEIPLDSQSTQTWLLTTYLDENLRISRSEGDGVFILERVVEPKEMVEGEVVTTDA
eukprot:TRINITY_DN37951_c0_g2_i1.p1 TRINITY_DN37951_c0_g2~~TRINITY_DN37951_c0_g2_i1.p1  ORF type:complete len:325 (-),score=37.19 TRINITY_DN37951_c0_g2_i1:162-1136(-)